MNEAGPVNVQPRGKLARRGRYVPWVTLALVGLVVGCTRGDIVGGNTKEVTGVQVTDGFLPQPELVAQYPGTFTPYLNVAYKAGSMVFNNGVGYFAGTATAEAYATDGGTNDLLWEGVDRRGGNAPMLQNTTDSWLDMHNAFKARAAGMVTKLQQAGVCETTAAAPT